MHRIRNLIFVGLAVALLAPGSWADPRPAIEVYKSPTCGCCVRWIGHLEANGFSVVARAVQDTRVVKRALGVPARLGACHTALIEGFVIEGHVPASDVARLLEKRPAVRGLAVPGMPVGSPGMEGPRPEPYAVLSFDATGRTEVFSSHAP
jgi:hypothetical protein